MRIERFGGPDPAVAVVGAIHGDEPCGARAIERFLDDPPTFDRPVAFVVANERALERGVRYVDEDMNRAFPGDPDADTHEGRLAARLVDTVGECHTLSMHSTQSYGSPFAIVDEVGPFARQVAPRLTLDALVEAGAFDAGRIFEGVPETIEVECGYQGSAAAADNAHRLVGEFLAAVDAVDPAAAGVRTMDEREPLPVYRLEENVPKTEADSYEVHVENFEEVAAGEVFASADGEPLRASDPFYPVLLSAEGYADQFGYTARYVETLG